MTVGELKNILQGAKNNKAAVFVDLDDANTDGFYICGYHLHLDGKGALELMIRSEDLLGR